VLASLTATMDDLQFNASLDALLANENMEEPTVPCVNTDTVSGTYPPVAPAQMNCSNSNATSTLSYLSSTNMQGQSFLGGESLNASHYSTAPTPSPGSFLSEMQYPQNLYAQLPASGLGAATAAGTIVPHSMASSSGISPIFTQSSYLPNKASNMNGRGNNSESTGSTSGSKRMSVTKKRSRDADENVTEVSEDDDDCDRRRHDRNLREQQRSQKITQQIDTLRSILSLAQVRYKSDKYSTLVTVGEYIKQLQQRSAMLDAEYKKLIDTITKTNDIVNEPLFASSAASSSISMSSSTRPEGSSSFSRSSSAIVSDIYNEEELVFVRNVDYKSIFYRCGIPLAVASIDGRLLDCNIEFEKVTGYKREKLFLSKNLAQNAVDGVNPLLGNESHQAVGKLSNETALVRTGGEDYSGVKSNVTSSKNLSLFNLLNRDCMEKVFLALSSILKHPPDECYDTESESGMRDVWSGNVRLNQNKETEVCF